MFNKLLMFMRSPQLPAHMEAHKSIAKLRAQPRNSSTAACGMRDAPVKGAAALLTLITSWFQALNPEILVSMFHLLPVAVGAARPLGAMSSYRIADGFNCECRIGSSNN
jgi:hypothetical protein